MAGACPAVNELQSALKASIPFLAGTYKEWNGSNLPRLQISGNPRHQMGVCLDVILFCEAGLTPDKTVDWQAEKKLGEHLVQLFVDSQKDMKWTEIIFQDRLFWEPEYFKPYGSDRKHFTHIHIDWMTNSLKGHNKNEAEVLAGSPQKDTRGFGSVLAPKLTLLNQRFNDKTLPGMTLATIPKPFQPGTSPVGTWQVKVAQWTWIYTFNADGTVTWRDPFNGQNGNGKWQITGGAINFVWINSSTKESWTLPISPAAQKGKTIMQGVTYDVNAVRS